MTFTSLRRWMVWPSPIFSKMFQISFVDDLQFSWNLIKRTPVVKMRMTFQWSTGVPLYCVMSGIAWGRSTFHEIHSVLKGPFLPFSPFSLFFASRTLPWSPEETNLWCKIYCVCTWIATILFFAAWVIVSEKYSQRFRKIKSSKIEVITNNIKLAAIKRS